MLSIEFFVIEDDIHARFRSTNKKDEILDEFGFKDNVADVYTICEDADIRSYLEEHSYPYVVYVGDSDPPASRTWKPAKEKSLTSISGIGMRKKDVLRNEGIVTVDDVRFHSQSDLSEIDGIGKALAARIKADVGDIR